MEKTVKAKITVKAKVVPDPSGFMIYQRSIKRIALSGTEEEIVIDIGDISSLTESVPLEIQTTGGRIIWGPAEVKQDDEVMFELTGRKYKMSVVKLSYHLTSEDYGIFKIDEQ